MYEQFADNPNLLSQHKALLDQLEAWHRQTKLSPAQEARYDLLYTGLEKDASELVNLHKDDPKAAAEVNQEPIQSELDAAANLHAIWTRIDFARSDTQQRYLNLLQTLRVGGIGALAMESAIETEPPEPLDVPVKLTEEGVELEGETYPYHPRAYKDKDNSSERRKALALYTEEPELELKVRALWNRVSDNNQPTKSAAIGLLAWLNQFETQGRKLFDITKPYGFNSVVRLSEGISLRHQENEFSAEFPDSRKYYIKPGEFYDAMHYLHSNPDLKRRMSFFGLRLVTEKMMNDIDVYRELPKRPIRQQPVTPEQLTKMAAARRIKKRQAVELLFKLMDDMPRYNSFLDELDKGEDSPAHQLTEEFLTIFRDQSIAHYKLREAWAKHLHQT